MRPDVQHTGLKALVDGSRNWKCPLIQHRPEHMDVCVLQLLNGPSHILAPRDICFKHQDHPIRGPSECESLTTQAEGRSVDQDVVKFLAQFRYAGPHTIRTEQRPACRSTSTTAQKGEVGTNRASEVSDGIVYQK